VLRAFRRLLAALEEIGGQLRVLCGDVSELCATHKAMGPAVGRLEKLELERHHFEAMCEGLLLKADGKLRAANNSEARERALRKSYEHLIDPLDETGERPETTTRDAGSQDDAAASEEERVHALRLDVAPNPKAFAQRAKFGVR